MSCPMYSSSRQTMSNHLKPWDCDWDWGARKTLEISQRRRRWGRGRWSMPDEFLVRRYFLCKLFINDLDDRNHNHPTPSHIEHVWLDVISWAAPLSRAGASAVRSPICPASRGATHPHWPNNLRLMCLCDLRFDFRDVTPLQWCKVMIIDKHETRILVVLHWWLLIIKRWRSVQIFIRNNVLLPVVSARATQKIKQPYSFYYHYYHLSLLIYYVVWCISKQTYQHLCRWHQTKPSLVKVFREVWTIVNKWPGVDPFLRFFFTSHLMDMSNMQ